MAMSRTSRSGFRRAGRRYGGLAVGDRLDYIAFTREQTGRGCPASRGDLRRRALGVDRARFIVAPKNVTWNWQ
jgi:hypothetical protein